jgi:hypothetical protein
MSRTDVGGHHERLAADDAAPLPSDRATGLVFAAAATVVGAGPLIRGGSPRLWALAVAAVFLTTAVARPRWLRPVNRLWMTFARIMQAVVTFALMAVIFYGVVTPLAWALRLFGHDPLRLRFEPRATSYWLERRPPGPAPETMTRQF